MFRLIRHGTAIGTHDLAFRRRPGFLNVDIAVDVLVKLGPIPLYRYMHRATETWRNGRLDAVRGQTSKNGYHLHMNAGRTRQGLAVEGSGTDPYIAPENALPTTYWNKAMLGRPLIGTQDGGLVRPRVTERGMEDVRRVSGRPVLARRYDLSGDLGYVLYDVADMWTGMSFDVADGSRISYEPL